MWHRARERGEGEGGRGEERKTDRQTGPNVRFLKSQSPPSVTQPSRRPHSQSRLNSQPAGNQTVQQRSLRWGAFSFKWPELESWCFICFVFVIEFHYVTLTVLGFTELCRPPSPRVLGFKATVSIPSSGVPSDWYS